MEQLVSLLYCVLLMADSKLQTNKLCPLSAAFVLISQRDLISSSIKFYVFQVFNIAFAFVVFVKLGFDHINRLTVAHQPLGLLFSIICF